MTKRCIQISFFLSGFIIVNSLCAQSDMTATNFEEVVMNYEPKQRQNVSDKDFNFASMVIRETKLVVRGDEEGFNRADYMNVLTAFLALKESKENIDLAFAKLSNSDGSCEYFLSFGDELLAKESFQTIRKSFEAKIAECKRDDTPKASFELDNYCLEYKLDSKLVMLISEVDTKDKLYRKGDFDNHKDDQRLLDMENQRNIDSLFAVHEKYLGKSMVGPKFESVMWAVIQHSNEAMMKKYLPVMKESLARGDMGEAMLKMTIDRYYALAHGYQVFGSQAGMNVDLATVEKRNEIARFYGIKN
ncbi:hypothetical protein O3Q51_06170 [Cryomorphaceae bacterium 1068]|nr:hypothetical protein [Cryomorphaceae bacterium 1068]